MITRHIHFAACILVACLSCTCITKGEEPTAKPKIEGTWVLKAIAKSDNPKDILPVKDDTTLRFVFDDSTLQVHVHGEEPKSMRYRLKEYRGDKYMYYLQFSHRPDAGWKTTSCHIDSRLYVVLSDADELLPVPIGIGDRDTRVCFLLERSR